MKQSPITETKEWMEFFPKLAEVKAGTVLATSKDMNQQIIAYGNNDGAYIKHLGGDYAGGTEEMNSIQMFTILKDKILK